MALTPMIKQMALRTSAIFVVKVIGFVARIPLYRMLGSEGIGRYQMVYSLYVMLLTLIMGGLPTSLVLMTANNPVQGWRIFRLLTVLFVVTGGAVSFFCFANAQMLAHLLGDGELAFAVRCIAPVLFVVPLLTLLRSLLQGVEAYGRIAVSELLEQFVRIVSMLLLISVWISKGTAVAVSGALLGALAGAAGAFLFLIGMMIWKTSATERLGSSSPRWSLHQLQSDMRQLWQLGFFITLSRFVMPASEFIDALIIPRRLQDAGLSFSEASSVYGKMLGMATSITYMPLIVTAALSHILSAKIMADWQQGKLARLFQRVNGAIHLGLLWGIGSSLVMFFYNRECSILILGDDSAAEAIRYLALAPLLGGLRELTTSVLWAMDRQKGPFVGLVLGLIVNNLLNYVLVGVPGFGYEGIAIAAISFEFIALAVNMFALVKNGVKGLKGPSLSLDVLILAVIFLIAFHLSAVLFGSHNLPVWLECLGRIIFGYVTISAYIGLRFIYLQNKHAL